MLNQGITHGLDLAKNRGYKRIRVESDSVVAISLIRRGCNREHPTFQMVQEIVRSAEGMEEVIWKHTLCEDNQVADILAKYSLYLSNNCIVFDLVPDFLVVPLWLILLVLLSPKK